MEYTLWWKRTGHCHHYIGASEFIDATMAKGLQTEARLEATMTEGLQTEVR